MENLGDLIINGMGKMNGGRFRYVEVTGLGKILGDVEAENAKITGIATIEGDIAVKEISSEGNCTIEGALEGNVLKNSGNIKIGGPLKVNNINNNGRFVSRGSMKAERIVSEGYVKVDGDMEAEEFRSEGAFKISGLLNASQVDVKVKWHSSAREVGGDRISVRESNWNSFNAFILSLFGKGNIFETELIEGTEILLENTKARIVRGDKIKIGPKCEIDLIEYSSTLEIDSESTVKNQVKI
jgi:cytoskeletal protein CcmA (bactofilin family)